MPVDLPEKKPSRSDQVWLFSKTIVFLLISGTLLLGGVVSAVWLGGIIALTTGSKVFGLLGCLSTYCAMMSGRDWAQYKLGPLFFSRQDQKEMSKTIDGK